MLTSLQFLGNYQAEFTHVHSHDEDELIQSDLQNTCHILLELDALPCLRFFPNVSDLILSPGSIHMENLPYLYNLPIRRLKLDYYSDELDEYSIDLGAFSHLTHIFSRTQFNFRNVENCTKLRMLTVQEWYTRDLSYLRHSNVEHLEIISGKLSSLNGIEKLSKIKTLSVSNQKSLSYVTGIERCIQLEHLEIESCNKLNLDLLPSLPSIKSLVIIGQQTINNCSFFQRFPKLERLLLGVKIIDGDLSPLLNLKHCTLITDHRHYSHRNSELPKTGQETVCANPVEKF